MTTSHSRLIAAVLVNGLVLGACQGLADEHTTAPPLATMHGTLSLAPGMEAPHGDIRLAIMWEVSALAPIPLPNAPLNPSNPCAVDVSKLPKNPSGPSGYEPPQDVGYAQFQLTFAEQHLEIESAFPVQFTLSLTAPPSREALRIPAFVKAGTLFGEGQFVVYRDGNANGKLDLRTFTTSSPDEILGASRTHLASQKPDYSYGIEYLNQKIELDPKSPDNPWFGAPAPFGDPKPGYGLLRDRKHVSSDTSIAIELSASPYVQTVLCDEWCQRPDDFVCPTDPANLPERDSRAQPEASGTGWYYYDGQQTNQFDEECTESSSGTHRYTWFRWACEGCMCKVTRCSYQSDTLPEGATLPCSSYVPDPSAAP